MRGRARRERTSVKRQRCDRRAGRVSYWTDDCPPSCIDTDSPVLETLEKAAPNSFLSLRLLSQTLLK